LIYGRECVRGLAASLNSGVLVAATDAGLQICNQNQNYNDCFLHDCTIMSCALSLDGTACYSGTADGRLCRFILSLNDANYESHSRDLTAYPTKGKSSRIVSISLIENNPFNHIVAAACQSPQAVSVMEFYETSVETIWTINEHMGLDCWITSIDALTLYDSENTLHVWMGGSSVDAVNGRTDAVIVRWDVNSSSSDHIDFDSDNNEGNDKEWCSNLDSDWDDENDEDKDFQVPPIFSHNLGHGAVYDMDHSSEQVAVAIDSDVLILEQHHCNSTKINVKEQKRFTTSSLLYAIAIRGDKIAACGAGETIHVWSLSLGIIQFTLQLSAIRHCNLSTNCIVCIAWSNETCLLSGGYDGNVSKWVLTPSLDS